VLPLGDKAVTVYDIVGKKILARKAKGSTKITIPPDSAVIAVLTPADGSVRRDGRKLLVNNVVVDSWWDAPAK
jgi:hypothetical protein